MRRPVILGCFVSISLSAMVICMGADGWTANSTVVEQKMKRPGGFNYVESKVPDYSLPDPLTASNGKRVTTSAEWNGSRRAELMELFRSNVYGHRPETVYQVKYKVERTIDDAFAGAATGQHIIATVHIGDRTYSFPFVIFVPNKSDDPVPVIVSINNRYFVPLDKAIAEPDPFWPAKTLVERGYATASFHTSDVDPDKKDGYVDGVRAFFANGAPPKDDAWRSLSAWGWAASKVLDFADSLDGIDATKSAVVGHSRGGKTALWCGCEDTRFAISYSNNSGCGGAALSRRAYGETVKRITTNFPHWFCPPYAEYSDRENELPVDQHEVMALIAPRAVYVASADEDLWADPQGEYTSLSLAAPVFELLGKKSISEQGMPPLDEQRIVGQTGYHVRSGGHNLGEVDWNHFLNFADGLLK